jgi:hypothetical protein
MAPEPMSTGACVIRHILGDAEDGGGHGPLARHPRLDGAGAKGLRKYAGNRHTAA